MSILVLVAHPDLASSRANARLADVARRNERTTVHDLYEHYAGGPVNVEAEQALAAAHDAIVFQHPLHWYSAPPALQHWQDDVLMLGWAYGLEGSKGMALEGKVLANAVSTGAPVTEYGSTGWNGRTLREFLLPFEGTAAFCGMRYHDPFVTYGVYGLDDDTLDAHVEEYTTWLRSLTG